MNQTQIDAARKGQITEAMKAVAQAESMDAELLRSRIAEGVICLPANINRRATTYCAIGHGLRTKVNANIGSSMDNASIEHELAKLKAAVDAGADAVMDLSTGGDLRAIRQKVIEASTISVGSVPIYEAASRSARRYGNVTKMSGDEMFDGVLMHCKDGVDFATVHCGVTRQVVDCLRKRPRVCGIVSRGGTFMEAWMDVNGRENPFYERFDELLDMLHEYDVTLSLGDGLRPGAIADACDMAQIEELRVLTELAHRALDRGVQVMMEGPGHVPLAQVETQIRLQKEMTGNLPFYVLGPIVTDVAPGYDHITSAIGGAIAAMAGADFLCYVTPTEHLSLPKPDDVHTGVIAARIAAHAADIAKGVPGAKQWDLEISTARAAQDWQTQLGKSIDPHHAARIRNEGRSNNEEVCSMCGDYCVFKIRKDTTAALKK